MSAVTARLNHDLSVVFDSVEDCLIWIANFADYEMYQGFAHGLGATASESQYLYYRAKQRDFSRIIQSVKTTDGRYLKDVLKK